jgi:hypothetical protein
MIDRVTDRLPPWKGQLMNRSDRLELIKSTLTAMVVYISICMGLPPWVIKALEKIMKAFLWTGFDVVQGGKCLLAWKKVQRPLHLGGFGILDLKLFGNALRLRWLWLQRIDASHSWSLLSVTEDVATSAFFQASIMTILGNCEMLKFWHDAWLDRRSITDTAPNLVQVVPQRCRASRSVASALRNGSWIWDITGPRTVPVMIQYVQLRERLQKVALS